MVLAMQGKPKVECGCGKQFSGGGMKGHLRSNFHLAWEKEQVENPSNSTSVAGDVTVDVDVSAEVKRVLADPELLAKVLDGAKPGPVALLPEEEAILARARNYEDPILLAKGLRAVFTLHEWPNGDHPGNQIDWLREHNIPMRTLPKHLDPDEVRRYMNNWYAQLRERGWGKDWEIK
jgi:hypothetical protein